MIVLSSLRISDVGLGRTSRGHALLVHRCGTVPHLNSILAAKLALALSPLCMPTEKAKVTIYLDPAIKDKLAEQAKREGRSLSNLIEQIVKRATEADAGEK